MQADHDLNNLIAQYYQPRLIAKDGEHGMGKGMDGHAGKDLIIKVPCGTLVWRLKDTTPPPESKIDRTMTTTDEDEKPVFKTSTSKRPLIRTAGGVTAQEIDLSKEADGAAVRRRFSRKANWSPTSRNTASNSFCAKADAADWATATSPPRAARRRVSRSRASRATEGEYLLELRIMAEVGLVGYPNAGKSTLLTAISKARPKVAPYPFTTLHPQIGIVEYADWKRLTVCDVPGLIEGAHKNVGLGHAFLRHIQRCKILVLLLDMAGTDGRAPWDDYKQLLKELELYDPALLEKPRLVVANKMDEAVAEENLKQFKKKVKKVSCCRFPPRLTRAWRNSRRQFVRRWRKHRSSRRESRSKINWSERTDVRCHVLDLPKTASRCRRV